MASPRPTPSTGIACEKKACLEKKCKTYFYLLGVKYGYKHYLPFKTNHLLANSKRENIQSADKWRLLLGCCYRTGLTADATLPFKRNDSRESQFIFCTSYPVERELNY